MTCYFHPDTPANAFCRSCGRALCASCQRPAEGTIFCQEHVPSPSFAAQQPIAGAPNPYSAPPVYPPPPMPLPVATQTSPGLAFLLGMIPGVGAIYNGQYLKGLVHAIIFGLLISLVTAAEDTAGQPFLVMTMLAFYFYMPFEAYHTAKKRQLGVPIEEWSSLLGPAPQTGRLPLGPIILIGIGIMFLLDTLHVFNFRDVGRFWPVILILVGAYLLYTRLSASAHVRPVSYPSAPAAPPPANPVMEDRP